MKNKNFIFGDYQGTRRKNGGSVLTTVPTALARSGDFSEYPDQIFDPQTGDPLTGVGRTPFAGNRIPVDRLSPQVLNLLKLIPLPSLPGTDFNFTASGIEAFDSDQFNVRDDHYWSENLHLFGRYSFARFNRLSPSAFGELAGGPAFDEIGFAGKSDAAQSVNCGRLRLYVNRSDGNRLPLRLLPLPSEGAARRFGHSSRSGRRYTGPQR